jgi:hypothetical protein
MRIATCAYCGESKEVEREHVVPRCIFETALRADAKFVLVPTCRDCNASYSHDEDHFRNFVISAGSYSEATTQVFFGPMNRALRREGHGTESIRHLLSMIKEHAQATGTEHRIHPDDRVFRVLRKILRGLLYNHFDVPFPEGRVDVREIGYKLRPEVLELGDWQVIHPLVFRYALETEDLPENCHSLWFLQFFQNVDFFGSVSRIG